MATAGAQVRVQDAAGNVPPTARIVASALRGQDALTVSLSCDCQPGSSPIVAHHWDLGNGTTSSSAQVSATYGPGRFHVQLTVVDDKGLTARHKAQVVVTQGSREPPECWAEVSTAAGPAPLDVTWIAHAASEAGSISSLTWALPAAETSTDTVVPRRYTDPGRYDAELRVVDDASLVCSDKASTIAVGPNTLVPPRIISQALGVASCGIPYEYSAAGGGPSVMGNGALEWTAESAPTGLSIDPSTGRILWTPGKSQSGLHHVRLVVRNEAGADSHEFDVDVQCGEVRTVSIGCNCQTASAPLTALVALLGVLSRRRRK
jgi:MYXO-CTERM domain-containing protein